MQHSSRHNKALFWPEFLRPPFQIDQETSLNDIEELVEIVVLVPVVFALHDSETDDRVVDLAKSLVVPGIGARIDARLNVNALERKGIEPSTSALRTLRSPN